MKNLSKMTENVFVALVSILEKAMGGFDNFLYALAIVMAVEFITGLIAAVWDKKRSGMEWMKEILKKIIIFNRRDFRLGKCCPDGIACSREAEGIIGAAAGRQVTDIYLRHQ